MNPMGLNARSPGGRARKGARAAIKKAVRKIPPRAEMRLFR
jgi:hypothetical protein